MKDFNMMNVTMNKDMRLSEHITLGELTKTSFKTEDGNIPSRVVIENLRNLCENWLEDLRYSYNTLYHKGGIIINSGYRSPEVNRLAGGAWISPREPSEISMNCILKEMGQGGIGSTLR